MSKVQTKQTNLREKLAQLLDFRKMRDRLSGLGLYIGKDRTNTDENLLVRGGANVDDLQLAEISAAVGGNAVDVFVYDTSRDSDGGAWRKRTQHTSWYNEELNTTTRGARREFPAVAVIVAEAKQITIYDGDDPDLSMWMVFEEAKYTLPQRRNILYAPGNMTSIYALNGFIMTGSQSSGFWSVLISFLRDGCLGVRGGESSHMIYEGNLAERNVQHDLYWNGSQNDESWWLKGRIVDNFVRDVSMTILPNAPIDDATGLPVPTIAVATDGGVSVIKDDGTVVDITNTQPLTSTSYRQTNHITLTKDHRIRFTMDGSVRFYRTLNIPVSDYEVQHWSPNDDNGITFFKDNIYGDFAFINGDSPITAIEAESLGCGSGLTLFDENKAEPKKSIVAYVNSKYNTGWMCGDIKLAALSDSVVENVGVSSDEVIQNGESWTGATGGTAPTGWTEEIDGTGTFAETSGELTITQAGSAPTKIYQTFNVVKGRVYNIEASIKSGGGSSVARFQIANNTVGSGAYFLLSDITSTSYQTITKQIRAEDTGQYSVAITCHNGGAEGGAVFDYVRVRATTELITNGDFSNAINDSDGVGWDYADNGTSSYSVTGEVLTLSHTTYTNSILYQILNLVVGKQYVLTAKTGGTNYDLCNVRIGSSLGGNQFGTIVSSNATNSNLIDHAITFTPTQSETYISLRINSSSPNLSCDFDNISVRPAEEDRSVNENGLQIVGEINKTRVAPGADLVAYSGFSANNYLVQPYNEDLDFGTGDFCVMGWFNAGSSTGSVKSILSKYDVDDVADPGYHNRTGFNMSVHTDGSFYAYTISNGTIETTPYENAGYSLHVNSWNHFCVNKTSGFIKVYINGLEYNSVVTNSLNLSNSAPLYIGGTPLPHSVCEEGLSLLRISKTAPTPDQIAKIYRDEKPLFQEGAQATLYGTSDAVTALSYDEKTELLHVGTASGRSDFSGLRRINNTTTAITTSISAHNNLIAEQ